MKGKPENYHHYLRSTLSDNTRRAYEADLRHFRAWGGRVPSTPETLARYLADCAASMKVTTLFRHAVAIGQAHAVRGMSNPASAPLVKAMLRGIRRQHGAAPHQAKPLTTANLKKLVLPIATYADSRNIRDRALLLVGFAGAFRRSELVNLTLSDIACNRHGLVLHLRASKTDSARFGRHIAVPYGHGSLCPVRALKSWLEVVKIAENICISASKSSRYNDGGGALFRRIDRHGVIGRGALSGAAVNLILKTRMAEVGLNAEGYSAHSLRAGLVTSAAMAGVPTWQIQRQTGHTTTQMVTRYIRSVGLFDGNAARAVL